MLYVMLVCPSVLLPVVQLQEHGGWSVVALVALDCGTICLGCSRLGPSDMEPSATCKCTKFDFNNSGELQPQAKGASQLDTSDNCTELTGPPLPLIDVFTYGRFGKPRGTQN